MTGAASVVLLATVSFFSETSETDPLKKIIGCDHVSDYISVYLTLGSHFHHHGTSRKIKIISCCHTVYILCTLVSIAQAESWGRRWG